MERLGEDASFRAEVRAAVDQQVPWSIFCGRGTPAPGEPLWLDEDRQIVIGWQAYQDTLCPGCGAPKAEAWGPDNQHRWLAKPSRCHSCTAIQETHADAVESEKTSKKGRGLHTVATQRDLPEIPTPRGGRDD